MEEVFEKDIQLLCSHAKLERDKGYLALKSLIMKTTFNENVSRSFEHLEECLITFLQEEHSDYHWEHFFGYIEACKVFLESHKYSDGFASKLLPCGLKYLEHDEYRVRIAAGELLGLLCSTVNVDIYRDCEEVLIGSIRRNLIRNISEDLSHTYTKYIFHESAGWKNLETSMKGLQCIIEACGEKFLVFMNTEVLHLILETLGHDNRFVRETGYYLCASLARYGVCSDRASDKEMASLLAGHLRIGLADNWSQVRLAASVATRQFFQDFNAEDKSQYFRQLLPPMCLNRYYLAEGVKLYNQESWKLIVGSEGRKYVQLYIQDIVDFYIEQTGSDNHAVREAACHCIAELSLKIEKGAVRLHVARLLEALLICFKDESWPVRDTACIACSNFILAFPEECKHQINFLYPLFFDNLGDPIPSVRQGGAYALTNVAKAYGDDALHLIFEKVVLGLQSLKLQKPTSERYECVSSDPGKYGVVSMKHQRDNDFELHSNQQMYSCGSLAPKMHRGGCMDHSFKRESEPWEIADGCIYLVGEMASYDKSHSYIHKCLDLVIEATTIKSYTHHLYFFETINKVLPLIGKGLGKRTFKQYLDRFLDVIFYTAANKENALSKTAAMECITFLRQFIGPNIFAGRVEMYNPFYLKYLDICP